MPLKVQMHSDLSLTESTNPAVDFSFPFVLVSVWLRVFPAQEDFVSLAELEDSLLRNLFRGYQKWVRPVQHANDTITVRFGLKISQLVDVVRLSFDLLHYLYAA